MPRTRSRTASARAATLGLRFVFTLRLLAFKMHPTVLIRDAAAGRLFVVV
jgi:hypothetical protein